jgi:hypothetical protein
VSAYKILVSGMKRAYTAQSGAEVTHAGAESSPREDTRAQVRIYQKRLEQLFKQIREWLKGTGIRLKETLISINEGFPDSYKAKALDLVDSGKLIVKVTPAGFRIIGAEGRVDFVGTLDTQSVIYLINGGPAVSAAYGSDGMVRKRPLYSGVKGSGWYWIENARLGRAKRLTRQLFRDLVKEVSDYEF